MNTDAIKRFLTFLSSASKIERGQLYQLAQAAEASYYLRDIESQRELGLLLQTCAYPFNQIGKYYESIYLFRTGQHQKARQLLESVAESAPAQYRSKALLSLSAVEAHIGCFEESLRLRLQLSSSSGIDLVTVIEAQRGIAALRSMEGEHRAALRDLERFLPLAHIIGKRGHPAYINFLNSYAYELFEAHRMVEAEQVSNVIASSPLFAKYPEWQETVAEIKSKRKRSSVVSITHPPEIQPLDLRIQAAIDFMNANLHRAISAPELAKAVGLSLSHFFRMFKAQTGFTPGEYLTRLKMEKVRELLKNPALNIQEVMTLVGFETRSNFLRHFRKYFKSSPSKYRKTLRYKREEKR